MWILITVITAEYMQSFEKQREQTNNSAYTWDYCLEKTFIYFFQQDTEERGGNPIQEINARMTFRCLPSIFDQALLILISVCWSLSPQSLGEIQECTLQRSPVHLLTYSPASTQRRFHLLSSVSMFVVWNNKTCRGMDLLSIRQLGSVYTVYSSS